MDKQQMDKDPIKHFIVNGEQVKGILAQFETPDDAALFISNFVRTFDMVADIWDNKNNEKVGKYIGSLLHIMSFFSHYSQEINRMSQVFEPLLISDEYLDFLKNDTNCVVHEFKNGELV